MNAFDEVRLPARLAFGSTGGVERRTEVVALASGHECRTTPWAQGRRRYLVAGQVRALADAQALVAFFEARRGRLTGFRFRDPADDRSSAPGQPPGAQDQILGLGTGDRREFGLVKAYGDVIRPITKPVAGTVRIAVDGQETTAFSVDTTRGLVTLDDPPADGALVTAGYEFDVPVRFDTDRIDVTLDGFDAGRVVAVPLIEIRV